MDFIKFHVDLRMVIARNSAIRHDMVTETKCTSINSNTLIPLRATIDSSFALHPPTPYSRVHHLVAAAATLPTQLYAVSRQQRTCAALGTHLPVGAHDARTQLLERGTLHGHIAFDLLQLQLNAIAFALQLQLFGAHSQGVGESQLLALQ